MENKTKLSAFTSGDIGGITYVITNNIVNYLIVIATLSFTLGWPDEIVFGRVIPGISIGLMVGAIYYAWMARRLRKKTGRQVTALPSGVSIPGLCSQTRVIFILRLNQSNRACPYARIRRCLRGYG